MSVKTPEFKWDVPVLGEEANVPADLLSLATEIENSVKALLTKYIKTAGVGDAGKLLVVDATGAAAFKAMSGDATISAEGVLALGAEKVETADLKNLLVSTAKLAEEAVTTAKLGALQVTEAKIAALAVATGKIAELAVTEPKIAALAVSTAKIANGAVTSQKANLTSGVVKASGGLAIAEGAAFADIPGTEKKITPVVASRLLLAVTYSLSVTSLVTGRGVCATIKVDALGEDENGFFLNEVTTGRTATLFYEVALSAAEHTIKLRAKSGNIASGGGPGAVTNAPAAQYSYLLLAS